MSNDQIAFFWVGKTIATPTLLVKSIEFIYGKDNPKIFQLTDQNTPVVDGVTQTIRSDLSKDIMVARLEAYKNFPFNGKQTFFCDADCLFLNKLNLANFTEKIYLSKRKENGFVNSEGYPEFENKTFLDVMPFLFGAMSFKDGKEFFDNLLLICKDLPIRFHKWYGDQYALKLYHDKTNFYYNPLNIDKYLYITKREIDVNALVKLIKNDVKVITFKGRGTKHFILRTIKNLFKISRS